MYPAFKHRLLAASLALAAALGAPPPAAAQSYQIDCAILLCLAGGWPASVPCARALAEFIRRITPWPVELPLQIWRCPMGVSFDAPTPLSPMECLYDIALREEQETAAPGVILAQAQERADIDISDDAFDFVRSSRYLGPAKPGQ